MSITENPLAGNASLPDRDVLAQALPAHFALSGIAASDAEARAVARTLLRLAPSPLALHPSPASEASPPPHASSGTAHAPNAVSGFKRAAL